MTPYRTILAAALAVLPTLAASQTPAGWSAFTRTFQAYVDSDKVVGASVVLANEGRVVGRYDTGFADRGVKVDSATIYHWGSITKTLNFAAPATSAQRRMREAALELLRQP